MIQLQVKEPEYPKVVSQTFGCSGSLGSKSNSVVLVKSPMGSASAFPFLCY